MTDEPERKREAAWIGRLSRVGMMAQRMRGRFARISGPGERRPEQHGPAPVDGPAARQLQLERRTCGARLSKLRRGRRPAPAMKRCQGGSGRSSVVVSEPSKAPPVYLRRRFVRQYGRRKAMRIAFLSTVGFQRAGS